MMSCGFHQITTTVKLNQNLAPKRAML